MCDLQIVVRQGKLYSQGEPFVSYALPVVNSVHGWCACACQWMSFTCAMLRAACSQDVGNNTQNCNRLGGTHLTVGGSLLPIRFAPTISLIADGADFGLTQTQVIVGGQVCTHVVANASQPYQEVLRLLSRFVSSSR